eukprot:6173234-Pleurochrysis_carterae.AAC.1
MAVAETSVKRPGLLWSIRRNWRNPGFKQAYPILLRIIQEGGWLNVELNNRGFGSNCALRLASGSKRRRVQPAGGLRRT